jgi:hypothetical protein
VQEIEKGQLKFDREGEDGRKFPYKIGMQTEAMSIFAHTPGIVSS